MPSSYPPLHTLTRFRFLVRQERSISQKHSFLVDNRVVQSLKKDPLITHNPFSGSSRECLVCLYGVVARSTAFILAKFKATVLNSRWTSAYCLCVFVMPRYHESQWSVCWYWRAEEGNKLSFAISPQRREVSQTRIQISPEKLAELLLVDGTSWEYAEQQQGTDAGGTPTEQVETDETTNSLTRSKAFNTLRGQPPRDKGMERMESKVTT